MIRNSFGFILPLNSLLISNTHQTHAFPLEKIHQMKSDQINFYNFCKFPNKSKEKFKKNQRFFFQRIDRIIHAFIGGVKN